MAREEVNCELYVNSEFRPSYKIASDGFIFIKSKDEQIIFNQLACKVGSKGGWQNRNLTMQPIRSEGDQDTIVYFGDIKIRWNTISSTNMGTKTLRPVNSNSDSSIHQDEEVSYNAGTITVSVEDNMAPSERAFLTKYPETKRHFKIKKQIARVK
jgi:hypothetical protein